MINTIIANYVIAGIMVVAILNRGVPKRKRPDFAVLCFQAAIWPFLLAWKGVNKL